MDKTANFELPYASSAEADAGELLEALFLEKEGAPSAMHTIDKTLKAHDDAISAQKGRQETVTIESGDWKELADKAPFKYSATATLSEQIAETSVVKLYNDDPQLFSVHGFQIAAAENKSVTIYILAKPSESVSLTIGIIGG